MSLMGKSLVQLTVIAAKELAEEHGLSFL